MTERRVLQIINATNWRAMLAVRKFGIPWIEVCPVSVWALIETQNSDGTFHTVEGVFPCNDGGLVTYEDLDNFIGYLGPGERVTLASLCATRQGQ